jgi:hypothetical protein
VIIGVELGADTDGILASRGRPPGLISVQRVADVASPLGQRIRLDQERILNVKRRPDVDRFYFGCDRSAGLSIAGVQRLAESPPRFFGRGIEKARPLGARTSRRDLGA